MEALKTVIEQKQINEEELLKMFQEREAQLKTLCQESRIPLPGMLVALGLAGPMISFPLAAQAYDLTAWTPFFMHYV